MKKKVLIIISAVLVILIVSGVFLHKEWKSTRFDYTYGIYLHDGGDKLILREIGSDGSEYVYNFKSNKFSKSENEFIGQASGDYRYYAEGSSIICENTVTGEKFDFACEEVTDHGFVNNNTYLTPEFSYGVLKTYNEGDVSYITYIYGVQLDVHFYTELAYFFCEYNHKTDKVKVLAEIPVFDFAVVDGEMYVIYGVSDEFDSAYNIRQYNRVLGKYNKGSNTFDVLVDYNSGETINNVFVLNNELYYEESVFIGHNFYKKIIKMDKAGNVLGESQLYLSNYFSYDYEENNEYIYITYKNENNYPLVKVSAETLEETVICDNIIPEDYQAENMFFSDIYLKDSQIYYVVSGELYDDSFKFCRVDYNGEIEVIKSKNQHFLKAIRQKLDK